MLRWIGIVLAAGVALVVALVAVVAVAARLSDGPIGPFPGGAFEGPVSAEQEVDWSFAAPIPEIEFQLLELARSRVVWLPELPALEAVAARGSRGRASPVAHRRHPVSAAGGTRERPCAHRDAHVPGPREVRAARGRGRQRDLVLPNGSADVGIDAVVGGLLSSGFRGGTA